MSYTIENYLEQFEQSKLSNLIEYFKANGGTILKSCDFKTEEKTVEYSLHGEIERYDFSGATVYPVCSAGENRSQLSYIELEKMSNNLNFTLKPPHGVSSGIDPFVVHTITQAELSTGFYKDGTPVDYGKEFAYAYSSVNNEPNFKTVTGKERRLRIIEENTPMKDLNKMCVWDPETEKAMRDRCDNELFKPMFKTKTYILCFARGFHVMLYRLVENSKRFGRVFSNITIQYVNSSDPVVIGGGERFQTSIGSFQDCVKKLINIQSTIIIDEDEEENVKKEDILKQIDILSKMLEKLPVGKEEFLTMTEFMKFKLNKAFK